MAKKKDIVTGKAILVRGFWTQSMQYNGARSLPAESQTKWIVFQGSGEPFMGDYVNFYSGDLASMLSEETKQNMARYRNDQIVYRRKLLNGLCLMDEIDSDDDIALWSSDFTSSINDNIPRSLHVVGNEYHDNYLTKFRLGSGKGSFVEGESIYDDKGAVAFAIVELLETRATKVDAKGNFVMVRKPVGERISTKKGTI